MARSFSSRHPRLCLALLLPALASFVFGCGGDVNLGSDQPNDEDEERWGSNAGAVPDEDTTGAPPEELQTLYRGARVVRTFAVDAGTLYVLLSSADRSGPEPLDVELVACPADRCETGVRTLWKERTSALVSGLLVHGSELFWVDQTNRAVVACSTQGCAGGARLVGSNAWVERPAADSEFVYWLDTGSNIVRCARDGCGGGDALEAEPPRGPLTSGMGRIAAFGDFLYIMYQETDRRIVRIPRAGGDEETLYASDLPLSAFDVQPEGVYFATSVLTGRVLRCPLSGRCTAPEVLASNQRWPVAVTAAFGAVFWVNSPGSELALMRTGTEPDSKALEVVAQSSFGGSLADDGSHVYWNEAGADLDRIHRVKK